MRVAPCYTWPFTRTKHLNISFAALYTLTSWTRQCHHPHIIKEKTEGQRAGQLAIHLIAGQKNVRPASPWDPHHCQNRAWGQNRLWIWQSLSQSMAGPGWLSQVLIPTWLDLLKGLLPSIEVMHLSVGTQYCHEAWLLPWPNSTACSECMVSPLLHYLHSFIHSFATQCALMH